MSQLISDFTSAIRRCGLTPPDSVVADGQLHRFRSGPERGLNGFYRLSIVPAHRGGEIGFGLIGCWKRDVRERWCSREPGAIGERDRQAIEAAREAQRADDARAAGEAAKKAGWIWRKAGVAEATHPYLAAKGIGPRGLKEYKGLLVVPIYRDRELVSLQFIAPDGGKRFLSGGNVEGGYASLSSKDAAKGRLVIAEGFATAASLHAATGDPVVVAFNAGNLEPVARAIREKYPDAVIVIAADNDQWTRVRGRPVNVGIERARKAAAAVGGVVSWPDFPEDDEARPTDWNDYLLRHGRERTAEAFRRRQVGQAGDQAPPQDRGPPRAVPGSPTQIQAAQQVETLVPMTAAPTREPPPHEPWVSDWRGRLIPGKEVAEGHPYPFDGKSKTNAYLFVRHHDRFAGLLAYDEFADAVMLMRRPPWDDAHADFSPRPIRDDDFFMLAAHLEYCDVSASKETAADVAIRVAKENAINPPRDYLSSLAWDGRPRLDSWLAYYLGADEQPPEYLALVGSKWMIGAVSRVFEPGCKFDSVLILEGTQGLGKSMALRALATFHGRDYFLDSVGDIRAKDTLMTMQGKLIVEIAELASFRKSENEEIKAFITRQVDEYRPPYGRTVLRRPRYFVLAGSTNEIEEGYLTDDTGNRRYWPVKCRGIDSDAVARDADQLWAEAVARYRAGERTWLTAEEAVYSSQEQKSRFLEDAWQDRIAELVRHEWTIRIDDVLARLELKPRDINNMVRKRVKNSLRQLGWHETRRAGEGRVWRPVGTEAATLQGLERE